MRIKKNKNELAKEIIATKVSLYEHLVLIFIYIFLGSL